MNSSVPLRSVSLGFSRLLGNPTYMYPSTFPTIMASLRSHRVAWWNWLQQINNRQHVFPTARHKMCPQVLYSVREKNTKWRAMLATLTRRRLPEVHTFAIIAAIGQKNGAYFVCVCCTGTWRNLLCRTQNWTITRCFFDLKSLIVPELCESRGGRPGLAVLTSLLVSVDVKLYRTMLRHWSVTTCP